MSNTKSYRKYSAAAMAAAVAATAVVPVVAAAEEKTFIDVSKNNDHYDSIYALAKEGIVTGLNDGTGRFAPEDSIYRAQAANMFVRALELKTPANVAEVLEVYTDVDENSEYAEEIAAVTAAGIFGQFGEGKKGKFSAWEHINREQMASVLVRAYGLDAYEADKVDVNLKKVSPTHANNVQTLANLGITKALEDFFPTTDVTRGQFSSFLKRAMDKVADEATDEALVEATKLVEEFEAAVNTVEKAEELVKNRDKREQLAASFVPATNAIQKVKDDKKEELANRLDAANNVVIAAGSVSSVQNATKDLTEDNVGQAKTDLKKAENLVNVLADGDVKKALAALIKAEEAKIFDFEFKNAEIAKVTVADINDPINAGEETALTFTVVMDNDLSKEFTKAQFEEAFTDYRVEFYYADKSVLGDKADEGIVNPEKNVGEFKYQVEIFNPFKDSVAKTANPATVKVQDKEALAKDIVEVTELQLQDADGNKVDSVRPDKTVKIVATKGLNKLGDTVENPDVKIEEANFETNSFGYITKADGTINLLNADKNVGETETLTVKFESIEKAATIDVTVAKKGVADKLVTPSIKAVTDTEVDLTNGVKVLNQYGEEMTINAIEVANITGKDAPTNYSNGKATFTKAGEYTIYYKAEGLQGNVKATIIVAPDNKDWEKDFTLELNGENKVIDVVGENGPETLEFTATALYDGADVTHIVPDDVRLDVKSSDEDVASVALDNNDVEVKDAKIIVTAVGEGTTTLTVTPKQGDMPGQSVSIKIEVVDSTIKLGDDSFEWKVEKLPQGTVLTEDNLAEYLTVKDVNGKEVDLEEADLDYEIIKAGSQGYIVEFDEKHGKDVSTSIDFE